ncbi:gp53-like domain-containing protein [Allorhizobium taibaishanense]|uniref:Putative tail fiber protein gp53-like C-terminal domain-containing protein n=1 Tax=Allorhizobium taibaishanense TaxID=887144 RepID=A0A1Q9A146_9HYPH|nr:hypothetical protein [Allorhizobium taibaishanense]MBB4007816.1 hypothetical protein [Allorhizobium taibaishanense]OLP48158.1 hypothetical protein BJF91_08385 [Allorhizobium taibaishanense]
MTLRSDYTAGTISIAAGATAVTGSGTAWSTAGFAEGDLLFADGYFGIVGSVTSDTALTLAQPWRGGTLNGMGYRLRYQGDGSRISAQARQLIDLLGNSGNLEALGGLQGVANRLSYFTGSGQMGLTTLTSFARSLLDDADAATARATLGAVQQSGGTGQGPNLVRLGWANDGSGLLAQVDATPMGALWTNAYVEADPAARRAKLGAQANLGFTPVQQGGGTGQGVNKIFLGWDNTSLRGQVDYVDIGRIWSDFGSGRQMAATGYQRIPGGPLIQWGSSTNSNYSDYYQPLPVAFTSACWAVAPVADNIMPAANALSITVSQLTKNGFDIRSRVLSAGGALTGHLGTLVHWIAIGD